MDKLYERILTDPNLMILLRRHRLGRPPRPYDRVSGLGAQRHRRSGAQTVEANRLRDAHAHIDITDDTFDRTAGHLLDVLAELGVDPALIDDAIIRVAALRPYIVGIESDTRESNENRLRLMDRPVCG